VAALNMYRMEINIHEKELCVKLVVYEDCTEMHGQQNIKLFNNLYISSNILQSIKLEETVIICSEVLYPLCTIQQELFRYSSLVHNT
jgi:hypothetical protein